MLITFDIVQSWMQQYEHASDDGARINEKADQPNYTGGQQNAEKDKKVGPKIKADPNTSSIAPSLVCRANE